METTIITILQTLPLGHWLATSPFGIVYGTLLFDAFTGLILLLSKWIRKSYFSSSLHMALVFCFGGGTVLLVSVCYLYMSLKSNHWLFLGGGYDPVYIYTVPIFHILTLFAYAFFIGYLIDFVIRLGLWLKRGRGEKITSS